MPRSTYLIERSVTIAARPEEAYAQIVDFRKWRNWSVWEILDPDLRRTYVGQETGEGAEYTWAGNRKVGSGSMKITQAEAPSRVEIDLVFERPLPACSEAEFTIHPDGEGTRVTWVLSGTVTATLRARKLFKTMDTWIGRDLEHSLEELKLRLEERQA